MFALLVARPWKTGRVTPAVLVRKVDAEAPTLLLDESDTAFRSDKEYSEALRGVLNTGYERGGAASVCVGQGANITYRDFLTFCPKAIAGIGRLPDTVEDRSIRIELRRKSPNEKVEPLRRRKARGASRPMRERVERWAAANVEVLCDAEPALPDALSADDRAADIWEPLIAIADLAGGDWPDRARMAALSLSTGDGREDESIGVRLLADIRTVFDGHAVERIFSEDLAAALVANEESPWNDLRGKPLDKNKLARRLKPYGVRPQQVRVGTETRKGYRREDFADAWVRYLPQRAETGETRETFQANESNLDSQNVSGVSDVSPQAIGRNGSASDADACVCGAAVWRYTPADRAVCRRHAPPDRACSACGSARWWARLDGGWVCAVCHPPPSGDVVLETMLVVGHAAREKRGTR